MPPAPDNDPWADLYADLGVDNAKSASPAAAPDDEPEPAPADALDADAESDDADGDPAAGGETELGEDGLPKRRRRRRRRRGKKVDGVVGEAATAEPADPDADDEAPARPARPAPLHLGAPAGFDAAGEELDDLDADDAPAEEFVEDEEAVNEVEETSAAAARAMIADWNVPAWKDIVAGLYRPDR